MVKKSLCLALAALLALLMCSCSFIDSAMEEAGLDPDLRDKINTAWDEVAKGWGARSNGPAKATAP